ncbi:MAG: hypothetical protein KKB50_00920 [Planctomycetes bacterium]|nr:hypothetical protein [Planctomycetota bacterium]
MGGSQRNLNVDLFCLECGYNLRGLPGDPIRCPECGFQNPVGDVELPAAVIAAQLKQMETAPAVSVLALLFLGPSVYLLVELALEGAGGEVGCPLTATLIVVGAFAGEVARFRSACQGQPGWLAALVRYQLVAFALIAAVVSVIVVVPAYLLNSGVTRRSATVERLACFSGPLAAGVLGLGLWRLLPPIYRWVKAPMERLQRDVAVKIARDAVRRRMARRPRRGLFG